MAFSDYLSIVALVLASISLYVSWRQYERDRSHLKLSLQFQVQTGQGSAYILTIVNSGRRPATIQKCFAKLKDDPTYYPVFDKSTVLTETQAQEISIPLYGFRESLSHPLDIELFAVEDTTSKRWSIRTNIIGREIRQAWTPAADWLKKRDGK
jgi:hypothetical protein